MWTIVALSLAMLLGWSLLLSLVVVAHNLGHFAAARALGAGVELVSFGQGRPLLQRRDRRGTLWRLCRFPLFGFVHLKGDGPDGAVEASEGLAWSELRRRKRLLILLGGAGGNLVFAVLLLFLFFALFGQVGGSMQVSRILPGSLAEASGLVKGDRILAIGGLKVGSTEEAAAAIRQRANSSFPLTLLRGDEAVTLTLPAPAVLEMPQRQDRGPFLALGLLMDPRPAQVHPGRALLLALSETALLMRHPLTLMTRRTPPCLVEFAFGGGLCPAGAACRESELITGPCVRPTLANRLFYPLIRVLPGMKRETLAAKSLYIFALLSLLFGLLSLLPLPGFDGGRMIGTVAGRHSRAFFEGRRSLQFTLGLLFAVTALPILLGVLRNPWLVILLAGMAALLARSLWVVARGRRGPLDAVHLAWGGLIAFMFFIIALAAPV